jgi:hypothetical protein
MSVGHSAKSGCFNARCLIYLHFFILSLVHLTQLNQFFYQTYMTADEKNLVDNMKKKSK